MDSTRPVTFVIGGGSTFANDQAAEFVDIICINHYFAWYHDPGRLDVIETQTLFDLTQWHRTYNKSVILSGKGAFVFCLKFCQRRRRKRGLAREGKKCRFCAARTQNRYVVLISFPRIWRRRSGGASSVARGHVYRGLSVANFEFILGRPGSSSRRLFGGRNDLELCRFQHCSKSHARGRKS